jgi:hypothetical protein
VGPVPTIAWIRDVQPPPSFAYNSVREEKSYRCVRLNSGLVGPLDLSVTHLDLTKPSLSLCMTSTPLASDQWHTEGDQSRGPQVGPAHLIVTFPQPIVVSDPLDQKGRPCGREKRMNRLIVVESRPPHYNPKSIVCTSHENTSSTRHMVFNLRAA